MPKTKQKKITSFFNSQASSVIKEEVEEQQQQQVYECGDCGDIFDTQEFAMDHQKKDCVKLKKKKHAEAFCDLCQLNFASKYSLKAHIKSKHDENPKNFACSFCEKAFATKGQLTVHLRSHTKEKVFKCTVCEKAFSHRESLITHATTHTGIKPFECGCCQQRFSCIGNLIKHRRARPETCGLDIYSNKKVAERYGVKMVDNTPIVVTKAGESVYTEPEGKEEHEDGSLINETVITQDGTILEIEEIDHQNQDIDFEYNDDNDQEEEEIPAEQEFETVYVEEYIEEEHLDDQIDFDFIIEKDDIQTEGDDQEYEDEDEVYEEAEIEEMASDVHMSEAIEDEVIVVAKEEEIQANEEINDALFPYMELRDGYYYCQQCPKDYSKRRSAINHIVTDHHVDRNNLVISDYKENPNATYQCEICSRKFSYKKIRDNHQLLHGPDGNLMHKCNCCMLYFESHKEMESHLFAEHLKTLTCPFEECEKVFDYPHKVKKHVLFAHSNGKNYKQTVQDFSCEKCGKGFKTKTLYRDHVKSNCGKTSIYNCETCGKNFRSMGSLKGHKSVHLDSLEYECEFCPKRFRTKGQLTIHKRSHTKEKTYKCIYCPKAFSHRESLITHNTIHTGIKRFECNTCLNRFSCISNFIAHKKSRATCSDAVYLKVPEAETSVVTVKSQIVVTKEEPEEDIE